MSKLCGVCYPIHKTLLDDIINGAKNIPGFSKNSTVLNFVLMWDVSIIPLTPTKVSLTNTYGLGKINIFVILNLKSQSGEHAQCLHFLKRMVGGKVYYDCYRIEPHSEACVPNFNSLFKLEELDKWLGYPGNLNRLYPRVEVSYKGARYLGVQELTNSNDEFPLGMCLSWILYYLAMIAQHTKLFIHDDGSPHTSFNKIVEAMSNETLVKELKDFTCDTKELANKHAECLQTSRVEFTNRFKNPEKIEFESPVGQERNRINRYDPFGWKGGRRGGGNHVKKSQLKKKSKSKRKSKFIKKSKRLTKRRKNFKRKSSRKRKSKRNKVKH